MRPTRPRVRPVGDRHYRDADDYDLNAMMRKQRRSAENLDQMTHHMEFEDVGERPTTDVVFGGKNSAR